MRTFSSIAAGLVLLASTPALAAPCTLSPKQIVTDFLTTLQPGTPARQHFEKWVDPGYIQHNPMVPTGREGAIAFFDGFMKAYPGYSYTLKRAIAEGDLVAVHGLFKMTPDDRGSAVMDIFRVQGCKVMEHWDVVQPIPEKAQNQNGMF